MPAVSFPGARPASNRYEQLNSVANRAIRLRLPHTCPSEQLLRPRAGTLMSIRKIHSPFARARRVRSGVNVDEESSEILLGRTSCNCSRGFDYAGAGDADGDRTRSRKA